MQIQPPKTTEEAIRLLLHYVGIVKLTEDNISKVYKRSKELQVLMGGGGFWEGRMPYLKEMEEHIGYVADVTVTHSDKKWEKVLLKELSGMAEQWSKQEEEHLAKEEEAKEEEGSSKTINEENEEATKELDELIKEEPKEEKEKYPY